MTPQVKRRRAMRAGCRPGNASSARRSPSSSERAWPAPTSTRSSPPQAWRTGPSSSTSPARNMCCCELERREEARIAAEFGALPRRATTTWRRAADRSRRTWSTGLERAARAACCSKSFSRCTSHRRGPNRDDWTDHPVIVLLVREIERARGDGEVHPEVDAFYSATFFLLGVYGVLTTTRQRRDPRHDARQAGRIRRARTGDPMTDRPHNASTRRIRQWTGSGRSCATSPPGAAPG